LEEDRDLCSDFAGIPEDHGRAVAQWLVTDQNRLVVGATVARPRMGWMGDVAVEFHPEVVLTVEHIVAPVPSSTRSGNLTFPSR
jgi:hypothetical protein